MNVRASRPGRRREVYRVVWRLCLRLRSRLARWAPGCLLSSAAHLVLAVWLALVGFTATRDRGQTLIISNSTAERERAMKDLRVEITSLDVDTTSPVSEPIDSAIVDAGELVGAVDGAVAGVEATAPRSILGGIGEMINERGARGSPSRAAGSADFFGVQSTGNAFVFIVDSSRSMKGGRFAAALGELSRSIRQLKPEQRFYVIFYDENLDCMTWPASAQPVPGPVPATRDNVVRAEQWMSTVQLEAGAGPDAALHMALAMLPDAVYLLTDGEFGSSTEQLLASQNRLDDPFTGPRPKVVIHTIGFHSRAGEQTLRRIARSNGGTYQYVPPFRR